MLKEIEGLKKSLTELAAVLNQFKSEAVQLRILNHILGEASDETEDVEHIDKKPSKTRKRKKSKEKESKTDTEGKRKKVGTGKGSVATLQQILAGDFFDKPQTIGDLVEHSKNNLARTFKANDFSGALGRLVRQGKLSRKKNAEGQYEYKKAKA